MSGKPLTGDLKKVQPGQWSDWFVHGSGYVRRRRQLSDGSRETQTQHRVVMEEELGRPLFDHETVHHINGVRSDNRPENLELWSSSQPAGQRVTDKVTWAKEILKMYPWGNEMEQEQ